MSSPGGILLTGATGLLGRFLLRDLLLAGQSVAVLARGSRSSSARDRIDSLVAFWSESLGVPLAQPLVLEGELGRINLGLTPADRARLSHSCRSVLHAAAETRFQSTSEGEPWKTNVDGTRHLLEMCGELGLSEFHHVSTAFVCGNRIGTIYEDELDLAQDFHNDYERSKCAAERLVRHAPRVRATIYRPSVIIGDSRTGYTSNYTGFYRFLEFGDLLAKPSFAGRRSLPVRMPFTGEEPRNLVPVDWVAQAIARIVRRPELHGRTYHLVSLRPIAARFIQEVAGELLAIEGVQWVGSGGPTEPTALEELFLKQLEQYRPYLRGDPTFDCSRTRAALPYLPAPLVDRPMLARMIRFAIEDRWGRGVRVRAERAVEMDCRRYMEDFFPAAVKRSTLARVPLEITIGLDVRGPAGGAWTCRLAAGEVAEVRRGLDDLAEVVFRLDASSFGAIVTGRLDLQEAFFARRIEIEGNVEKGLKLAVLFGQFVGEQPFGEQRQESADAWTVLI